MGRCPVAFHYGILLAELDKEIALLEGLSFQGSQKGDQGPGSRGRMNTAKEPGEGCEQGSSPLVCISSANVY